MTTVAYPEENKSKNRMEDLQKIILSTLTSPGPTSFEAQIAKEGYTHQEVYVALENLKNTGALKITETTTEYSPATEEIHESRKYSLLNDSTRGLSVDIYRKSPKK